MGIGRVEDKRGKKLELIYESCYSYMCYTVSKYIKKREDIEDTVQDAIVNIIRMIDKIDTSDSDRLKFFCIAVARNKAIDRLRSVKPDTSPLSELAGLPDPAGVTPESAFIEDETASALVRAMDSLDVRYRDVCILRFSEGYKEREIAEALGIPIKTVHTRISRGRKLLISAIEREQKGDGNE